jgi:hypothetical protein
MAGSHKEQDRRKERKKFAAMAAAGAGTAGLFVIGAPVILGAAAIAGTGYLAYDWFMYRAKRGMRF